MPKLSEQELIRREKLEGLKNLGINPYPAAQFDVIDQGCGSILIVFILTLCGWVPGVISALVILNNPGRWRINS